MVVVCKHVQAQVVGIGSCMHGGVPQCWWQGLVFFSRFEGLVAILWALPNVGLDEKSSHLANNCT